MDAALRKDPSLNHTVGSECQSFSHVRLFATHWSVAHQAPLSMEFSRQEYWSGLPFPTPGDLSYPGIKPRPPTLQAYSLPSEPPGNYTISINHTVSWRRK